MESAPPTPRTPKPVGIVPHTHWDREWYAPFQRYRVQLVHLVDGLLDLLEADPSFTRFLLDGQTAVIDDYLAVRPEAEARLQALAHAGRLQVGPWMILMDEFMVSGETMIRNLQRGLARSQALEGSSRDDGAAATRVGYLPDMFGHIAQMPQLLRLARLEHAVVWRGVPAAIDRTAFRWRAPDGSTVRAEYLYGSYSNGRDIPKDPTRLVARARGYDAELGAAALPGGGMLLMNGSDHLLPQPWLGDVVAAANALQDEYCFSITSLGEYVRAQPTDGLPTWDGELRSGARANVLMGVASNRVDVHQLAARAERVLERSAEPLSALLLAPDAYPGALLDVAWRELVLNSAHDSSCACSADEVVEAVRVRYQEARHVGEELTREAVRTLATTVDVPPSSTIVVNGTARERSGVVTIPLPGAGPVHLVALDDGTTCPSQVVHTTTTDEGISTVVVGRKIRWVLEMMRGPELAGARIARVERRRVEDTTDGGAGEVEEFTFHDAAPGEPALDLEATREELLELGESGATISIRQRRAPVREVALATGTVPGFGWRSYRAVEGEGPATAVRASGLELANEHLHAVVDPGDGTLTVNADGVTVAGLNRYVDGGDGGDTYNYSPPALDTVVDRPEWVTVAVAESGPVRARLVVTARYSLPTHALGDERACRARSEERTHLDLVTTYELRTGERFVRVHVELDHHVRDHRLRAHFPLPAPVSGSDADCAFAIVHRGFTAEGGPHEFGLPTFVSRHFVDCSGADDTGASLGLALVHDGLLEYEVLTDTRGAGTELALTLVRATGYLSRSEPELRPNPAGPLDRLEGPQLQTALALDYAILLHRGEVHAVDLPAVADDVLVPLERVRGGGWPGATGPASGSLLEVHGAEVSALLRDGSAGKSDALVLRVVNRTPEASELVVARAGTPVTGDVVDLTGADVARFDGRAELRPWQILTLRLAGI